MKKKTFSKTFVKVSFAKALEINDLDNILKKYRSQKSKQQVLHVTRCTSFSFIGCIKAVYWLQLFTTAAFH